MVTEMEVTKMKKSFILLALLGLLMSVSCTKEEVVETCDIDNQEVLRYGLKRHGGVNNIHNWKPRHSSDPNVKVFYWEAQGTLEVILFECVPVGARMIWN